MDSSFFSTENEDVLVEFIEIKAKTRSKSDKGTFILVISADELESDDFFGLEFVLHEVPVHDSTVRRNGVEVIFFGNVGVPVHLPDGVSVLLGSHVRLINGSFVFVSNVVNEDCSVVKTDC